VLVKELIEELSQLDPHLAVVKNGYEGGYDNASTPCTISVYWNDNWDGHDKLCWYEGQHQSESTWGDGTVMKAVLL
jgi:hypothetical protein